MRPRQVRMAWEELILATSQSALPQCWLAPPRMNSPRQVSDTACQARSIGTRAQVANVPVEPSPNGTLLTSDCAYRKLQTIRRRLVSALFLMVLFPNMGAKASRNRPQRAVVPAMEESSML